MLWGNLARGITILSESTAATSENATGFRWVVLGLVFFITMVNYLDRSAISYAITDIKGEFGLNDQDFGFVASAFGIGYMIMTVAGGIVVDKWGSHKIWAAAAFLWSACTAMMGLASGFWILFVLRTLLGIAEGPHFPALTRVVADWLPMSERGRSTALGLAAVPLASVIGAPLITSLIFHMGWKVMFVILGSLGIVWAAVWLIVFKDYPELCRFVNETELKHIREGRSVDRNRTGEEIRQQERMDGATTWKFMLLNPSLLANNLAFFSFGYILFFALTWLPGFLEETYHLQLKQVGVFLIAPWLTAGILLASAGFLSDWLWHKTGSARKARSHMIWICQLLSALSFIPVMFTKDLTVAITSISLGVGFGLMPNAAFYALNCDLAKDRAATSQGIMNCCFAMAGILAPAVTGILVHQTGSFSAPFGLLVVLSLMSVLAVLFFQKPDEHLNKNA